jgi:hypothetical protein
LELVGFFIASVSTASFANFDIINVLATSKVTNRETKRFAMDISEKIIPCLLKI